MIFATKKSLLKSADQKKNFVKKPSPLENVEWLWGRTLREGLVRGEESTRSTHPQGGKRSVPASCGPLTRVGDAAADHLLHGRLRVGDQLGNVRVIGLRVPLPDDGHRHVGQHRVPLCEVEERVPGGGPLRPGTTTGPRLAERITKQQRGGGGNTTWTLAKRNAKTAKNIFGF